MDSIHSSINPQKSEHEEILEKYDRANVQFLTAFLIIHIFSYLAHYYRIHDIKLNGMPDINGVYTAKKEALLGNIEAFIICILVGFTTKHLIDINNETDHL